MFAGGWWRICPKLLFLLSLSLSRCLVVNAVGKESLFCEQQTEADVSRNNTTSFGQRDFEDRIISPQLWEPGPSSLFFPSPSGVSQPAPCSIGSLGTAPSSFAQTRTQEFGRRLLYAGGSVPGRRSSPSPA